MFRKLIIYKLDSIILLLESNKYNTFKSVRDEEINFGVFVPCSKQLYPHARRLKVSRKCCDQVPPDIQSSSILTTSEIFS